MITIHYLTVGPFQENSYILHDETKECVFIDPGFSNEYEEQMLERYVADNQLIPVKLLNTHCHLDHMAGNGFVAEKWGLPLEMHKDDLPTLQMAYSAAKLYGLPEPKASPEPSVFLEEGNVVEFGKNKLDVLFTPGHAPGHIVFVNHAQKFVINGDVLFQGSIGRTDLPGGDHDTLINSIKEKMMALDDDFEVYTGHGPKTTIGFERVNNPFL